MCSTLELIFWNLWYISLSWIITFYNTNFWQVFASAFIISQDLRLRISFSSGIWIFSLYFKCHGPSEGVSWAMPAVIRDWLFEGSFSFYFVSFLKILKKKKAFFLLYGIFPSRMSCCHYMDCFNRSLFFPLSDIHCHCFDTI